VSLPPSKLWFNWFKFANQSKLIHIFGLEYLFFEMIVYSESLGRFDMDDQNKANCEIHLLFQTDELKKHYG
jgi:hypothetical protein